MAATAPSEFFSGSVSVSTMPWGVSGKSAASASGVQPAQLEGQGGLMFRVSRVLIGIDGSVAPASLAARRGDQLSLAGDSLFSLRTRIGFGMSADSGIGFVASLEPGIDALPFVWGVAGGGSETHENHVMPRLGASVAATYDMARVRLYAGLSGTTMPVLSETATLSSSCVAGCITLGQSLSGVIAFTTGARLKLGGPFAAAFTFTMPVTRVEVPWTPMLALSLSIEQPRAVQPEAEPEPAPEEGRPPPRPPLVPAPPPVPL
jgi:hypothetical protein